MSDGPPDADDALLARFAEGDQAAARSLTERHATRVLSLARRMLGDAMEAEDVTQEAMMRMWQMAPEWRPGEAKLSTWLYRVTANLCTDRLRRRRRISGDEPPEIADETPGVEARLIASDRMAALDTALAKLPERQRQAVTLRHIEGLANPEIAAVIGVSVEAVESLTARAKRALAAALRELGDGTAGGTAVADGRRR